MSEKVFFYGTLMAGFDRRRRAGIDMRMHFVGRGGIEGALFDLGLFPAAIPSPGGHIQGEVYEVNDNPSVMAKLDEIEGFRPSEPDTSLYTRLQTAVTLDDGSTLEQVWVDLYNAPLGRAQLIPSGDYLEHLRPK